MGVYQSTVSRIVAEVSKKLTFLLYIDMDVNNLDDTRNGFAAIAGAILIY